MIKQTSITIQTLCEQFLEERRFEAFKTLLLYYYQWNPIKISLVIDSGLKVYHHHGTFCCRTLIYTKEHYIYINKMFINAFGVVIKQITDLIF